MRSQWQRSIVGVLLVVLLIAFCASEQFRDVYNLPAHILISQDESTVVAVSFPLTVTLQQKDFDRFSFNNLKAVYVSSQPITLNSLQKDSVLEFKLFGIIPLRTVEIDVMPTLKLVPGGHSIGVVLHSQGILVVGNSPVLTSESEYIAPAKEAGILVGDVILSINGTPTESDTQVAEIIDQAGRNKEPVNIYLKRGEENLQITVNPVLCNETKRFRIGLFVRDSAAGVGTLTFYDPDSHIYGALGHIITDADTNQPISCEQGKIVLATVSGIQLGKRGQPGEKVGVFIDEEHMIGDIRKNTSFGIYGKLNQNLNNSLYEPLPVASMTQVEIGPAEMLTVIDGQTIEKFSIEIQKINLQELPEGKGLVIKITDPRLIDKTGGIVQGMSGSPIIQNGKIVGAVTHVFIHDPTRGYGCFVDWMLMESGFIPKKEKRTARRLFALQAVFFSPNCDAKSRS